MAGTPTPLQETGLGSTLRRDAWWVELLPVIVLFGGFGIYATLRAFEGKFYEWGPYLSPFYSPLIDPQHHWWKLSPALIILGGPLGFRATCYYYRKAYYRAFFLDPPACAVGEPSGASTAEKPRFLSFCRMCIATFCIWRLFLFASCGGTRSRRSTLMGTSGLVWARSSCCSM